MMSFEDLNGLVLENDRVRLSPLLSEHYQDLEPVALKHGDILQYSPNPVHSPELLKAYIDRAQEERRTEFRCSFVVYDKQVNQYAGSTSFANFSWYDQRVEIGWTWLGKDFQRTGLNRQMKYLMLEFAFEKMGFERVEFRTDERNKTSRTAIVKIGGKFEGILRHQFLMPDGFRRSSVYYSILAHEWPEVKKNLIKSI